ncbi:hypothetical protein E0Z10_g4778 [Xylaria hypoxylon]|uniref:Trichodiene synthase n=1 Tax=Xylaria hypoxylon TaxID=37992 RepID=A0A4Z0YXV6_9PEZI|nr:hypothetical protein E0Z10_g4778 [Xylaria hypoxylon]
MHATTDKIGNKLKPLLVQFEKELFNQYILIMATAEVGYTSAKGNDYHALFDAMHVQATRIGIPYPEGSHSWHAFNVGASYALLCYRNLPLEVRVFAGILTWLAVLIDDGAQKDPEEWYQFIPRFHTAVRHPSALAQEFDRWLRTAYQHYPPVAANFIVSAFLNFVNASALEGGEVPKVTPTTGGRGWPYYLREKNSISEGYAWMTFPKAICPDVSCYIEAIADMTKYICFTNDILSFYKEECACDRDNYMHIRTSYEDVSVFEVFKKVIEENLDAHRRITLVLEGKEPYAKHWHDHVLGYVGMHKTTARYKLRDLGLDESLPKS